MWSGTIVIGKRSFSSSAQRRRKIELRQTWQSISAVAKAVHQRAGPAQASSTLARYGLVFPSKKPPLTSRSETVSHIGMFGQMMSAHRLPGVANQKELQIASGSGMSRSTPHHAVATDSMT